MTALLQRSAGACPICGVPLDSSHFDESGFAALPAPGRREALARVELPERYCGVLEYFAQFTDAQARDPAAIETPGLEWTILLNRRPLSPYLPFRRILNPWGFGSFPLALRLGEGATVELVVARVGDDAGDPPIARIGGRIVGRYWYSPAYGDAPAAR